jgi:hypothetical protein
MAVFCECPSGPHVPAVRVGEPLLNRFSHRR